MPISGVCGYGDCLALAQQGQFGTATEARAMLDKAVAAVRADKAKALESFNAGTGGFRNRDLYPFCANALMVWKLDRLGRDLRHLVNLVHDLTARGVGLKVLAGEGAAIDTTTASGKLVFGIFAALAEFERALIVERTKAGIAAARARGRNGGAPFKMTAAKLRLAQAAMGKPETKIALLWRELGISRQTLYRHVSPDGALREHGAKLLGQNAS